MAKLFNLHFTTLLTMNVFMLHFSPWARNVDCEKPFSALRWASGILIAETEKRDVHAGPRGVFLSNCFLAPSLILRALKYVSLKLHFSCSFTVPSLRGSKHREFLIIFRAEDWSSKWKEKAEDQSRFMDPLMEFFSSAFASCVFARTLGEIILRTT